MISRSGTERTRANPARRTNAMRLAAGPCLLLTLLAAPLQAGWNGMTTVISESNTIYTVLAQAPGDPDRLYVGIKEGLIRTFNLTTNKYEQPSFLDLRPDAIWSGEGGLMGLTFDPDYQNNGKFYLTLTVDNGGIEIAPATETAPAVISPYSVDLREYQVSTNPNVADPESKRSLLSWVKPHNVHTGGWLGFSPNDGYLYLATGDGGGVWDNAPGHTPGIGNAQDLTDNWMGKILRIDPAGDDFPDDPLRNYAIPPDNPFVGIEGDDEIYAYGLRSPWRASFDRETGDFWIADVGEVNWEEVNFIPAGSPGGQNFGWRLREGANPMPRPGIGGPPPPRNAHPVYDYAHLGTGGDPELQGNSVTGGYVYRGSDPELQGMYVFADFISQRVWMFDPADPYGTVTNITSLLRPQDNDLAQITSLFEDSAGELYIATAFGKVFRLNTDNNGLTPGDFQGDGYVDADDLAIWRDHFGTDGSSPWSPGDADGDGDVDGNDFLRWQQHLTPTESHPLGGTPLGQHVPEPGLGAILGSAAIAMGLLNARTRRS